MSRVTLSHAASRSRCAQGLVACTVLTFALIVPPIASAEIVRLGAGNWSYFTDPRVVSYGGAVYTGWIATSGRVTVTKFDPLTGRRQIVVVGATGVDDHNNPALHMRSDGRLMVFFSPHCGRYEPKGQVSRMYYRIAARPHSVARWGPKRHVPVNAPGRLGYTYPNPIGPSRTRRWTTSVRLSHADMHEHHERLKIA